MKNRILILAASCAVLPVLTSAETVEVNPTATPFVQLMWSRVADINGEAGAVESADDPLRIGLPDVSLTPSA